MMEVAVLGQDLCPHGGGKQEKGTFSEPHGSGSGECTLSSLAG